MPLPFCENPKLGIKKFMSKFHYQYVVVFGLWLFIFEHSGPRVACNSLSASQNETKSSEETRCETIVMACGKIQQEMSILERNHLSLEMDVPDSKGH